jgi:nucleoside-diphosphate-sugar epimerase
MTVLVTGAGGFVGGALCAALLNDGHDVVGVLRPGETSWRMKDPSMAGIRIVQHDIVNPDFANVINEIGPTEIFHLAAHGAYSWQNDAPSIVNCNLTATIALADAAAKVGSCKAFVHTGSSSEYGLKVVPHAESDLIKPNSVYAVSKAAATHYLGHLARTGSLNAVTARLFSIYGPFEDSSRLIPQVVIKGREGSLPPLASPTIARDFVYVDDAVRCLRQIAETVASGGTPGEVVNVCSGIETTLADVADASAAVFPGVPAPAWGTYESRHWDTNKWSGDPKLARTAVGWSATTSLRDGLRKFSEWIEGDELRAGYYGS